MTKNPDNDKIRILLLEDNREHIAIAKAGLIPISAGEPSNVDIMTRVRMADANYLILHCYTIKDATQSLATFRPDFAIIDIAMRDTDDRGSVDDKMKSGIDFYRYLNSKEDTKVEKILFSSHFATARVFNQLSDEEKQHFVPKGTKGTGYEMLAGVVAGYLGKIAGHIISAGLPMVTDKITDDLMTHSFQSICEYPYHFGNRSMSLKHLLMSCSSIESDTRNKGEFVISYQDPGPRFIELATKAPQRSETDRAAWKKPYMQNAVIYYGTNLAERYEPAIINETKKTVRTLFKCAEKDVHMRLAGFSLKDFDPKFFKDQHLNNNKKFLENFINALIIRRTLIFLELFASKYVDSQYYLSISSCARNFLNKYIDEFFQAIKIKSETFASNQLTQFGDMLNFKFRTGNSKSGEYKDEARQGLASSYRVYEFEKSWLHSEDFRQLTEEVFIMVKK